MKPDSKPNRRDFLKFSSTGAVGLALLGPLFGGGSGETGQGDFEEIGSLDNVAVRKLRKEFLLDANITYLNHASIGTMRASVHKAHTDFLALCETNPWLHMWGGEWEEPREETRKKAATLIGADADEIALVHNTTEVFCLAAAGLPLKSGDEVLFSSLNHSGASVAFQQQAARRGFGVKRFDWPVERTLGMSKADVVAEYEQQISRNTKVLVLPHIDNTIGLRLPIKEITSMARAKGVRYIGVDTAQTVGMIPVDVTDMDVDFMGTSAHKWVQAPKGISFSYIKKSIQNDLQPMWMTWGQGRWKDSARRFEDYGTRNLAEVLTLGAAIDAHAAINDQAREDYLKKLWAVAKQRCADSPKFKWYSPEEWELGGSLYAIEVAGKKSGELFGQLFKEHGLVFRPFRVGNLQTNRISPNVMTTEEELHRFFDLATA